MENKKLPKLPKLGFGLMRLPVLENDEVDILQMSNMVDAYMSAGFNYFDTAYPYHQGRSEMAVKEAIVNRYPRESFYLASKLPAWMMKEESDRDRIFNEQLERPGAGYFDFYLLHAMEDGNNHKVYEEMHCFEWAQEKKKAGLIRHFGFSFHGTPELLKEVLDAHPEVEFVQTQLNYLDWENPIRKSGELYHILQERKIPVLVMEPVKGGSLASFTPKVEAMFKAARPDASIASWALRFAASLDGVVTVLSGMSNEEQMRDNLNTFTRFEPLSEDELALIKAVEKKVLDIPLIQCTACRYCRDGCPQSINIPEIFKAYNTAQMYPMDVRPKMYYAEVTENSGKASECIGCGQCEGVCPQHLTITSYLKEIAAKFEA